MVHQGKSWFSMVLAIATCLFSRAQEAPRLLISPLPDQKLELTWPDSANDFVLEQTGSLADGAVWIPVAAEIRDQQGFFLVHLAPAGAGRFLRLRQTSSSPAALALSTRFAGGKAQEGQVAVVWAIATGVTEVQIVDLLVDDQIAGSLTNAPYAFSFVTPLRRDGKTSFTLQARLRDLHGETILSERQTFQLQPDSRPPAILASDPPPGSLQPPRDTIEILFAEPIQAGLVTEDSVRLLDLGSGELSSLAADKVVPGIKIEIRADRRALLLRSTGKLRPGFYGIQIRPPLADLAGNSISPVIRRFRVFDPADSDQDGVPDTLEPSLRVVVGKPDTDGNGRNDGLEDFDQDGLANAFEILHGTDPLRADSDGDGINDGAEDTDKDGLTDAQEALLGTDPARADTDGDGWSDEAEVTAGSNPLDPRSVPDLFVVFAAPAVEVILPAAPLLRDGLGDEIGLTLANPSLTGLVPGAPSVDLTDGENGVVLANPLVRTVLPAAPSLDLSDPGTALAQPFVKVTLPQAPEIAAENTGTTLALPAVTLRLDNNNPETQQIP